MTTVDGPIPRPDQTAPANDPAAHAMLRRAYEATYRYPPGFAGFRAALEFTRSDPAAPGAAHVARGQVQARSPQAVSVEVETDAAGRNWLWQELASIIGHRWPTPYEEADGRHGLTLGPDDGHPLGRLLQVHGDRFGSSYRVRDGQIAQIIRRFGNMRFAIHIQERVATSDGRTLPTQFTVAYWEARDAGGADDPQGAPAGRQDGGTAAGAAGASGAGEPWRLTRADTYSDHYVCVAGLYLPECRRVITADDRGLAVHEVRLSGHALLPPAGRGTEGGAPAPAEGAGAGEGIVRRGTRAGGMGHLAQERR
jgi:hypothetical protein